MEKDNDEIYKLMQSINDTEGEDKEIKDEDEDKEIKDENKEDEEIKDNNFISSFVKHIFNKMVPEESPGKNDEMDNAVDIITNIVNSINTNTLRHIDDDDDIDDDIEDDNENEEVYRNHIKNEVSEVFDIINSIDSTNVKTVSNDVERNEESKKLLWIKMTDEDKKNIIKNRYMDDVIDEIFNKNNDTKKSLAIIYVNCKHLFINEEGNIPPDFNSIYVINGIIGNYKAYIKNLNILHKWIILAKVKFEKYSELILGYLQEGGKEIINNIALVYSYDGMTPLDLCCLLSHELTIEQDIKLMKILINNGGKLNLYNHYFINYGDDIIWNIEYHKLLIILDINVQVVFNYLFLIDIKLENKTKYIELLKLYHQNGADLSKVPAYGALYTNELINNKEKEILNLKEHILLMPDGDGYMELINSFEDKKIKLEESK
jgi:hypothetical protein